MTIFFIRHGESEANEQNLFAGRFDSQLTPMGKRQAIKAGRSILDMGLKFDVVHVSPLSRARETAELVLQISQQSGQIEKIVNDDLVERDFGVLSENNKSLIKKHFGHNEFERMFHSPDGKPDQGESFAGMYERVLNYYKTVLLPESNAGRTILVVAHKYIVEMFALIAAGLEPKDYFDFKIPNSKPTSFEDLGLHVRSSSKSVQWMGEFVEIHLPLLMFVAALLGTTIKQLLPFESGIYPPVYFLSSVLLLALNSFFSFLRPESKAIFSAFSGISQFWKSALIRAAFAMLILIIVPGPTGYAAGTFFLLPPSIAAPMLSLMWGGNYFISLHSTLVLSLLSLAIFAGLSTFSSLLGLNISINLIPFLLLFAFGVALPALLAQISRVRSPIKAGSTSTNWGWVGGVALILLALLSGFQLSPHSFTSYFYTSELRWLAAEELGFVVILFASLRVLGSLAVRICYVPDDVGRDLYICQVTPNIFFWFVLLPKGNMSGILESLTLLTYFFTLWLEERRFVIQYGKSFSAKQ